MKILFFLSFVEYRILGKKGEGTFSEVLKCQNVRDGTFWAAKKMKQLYKNMDEIHQIREIRVLRQLNGHPNIIFLREIILYVICKSKERTISIRSFVFSFF